MMITRLLLAALLLLGAQRALAQEPPIRAELPVLVTSSGQSLAAFTVKTLMGRNGIANDYKPLATVDDVKAAKTVVIAFGASVKGFGAAGITAESELARTRALLAAAREAKVRVIGVHIGGAEGRGGLSQPFIELVAPAVDYLLVWEDGNADGWFTRLAQEKSLPLTLMKQPLEVGAALKPVFAR